MSDRFRKYLADFNLVVTTARNLQITLVVVALAVAGLVTLVTRYRVAVPVAMAASAALALATGLVAGWTFATRRAKETVAQTGFRVVEFEMHYSITADVRRHECRRRFLLEATNDGAQIFSFSYTWSGEGGVETTVASLGHRLLGDSISSGALHRCAFVDIGRPQSRGERTELVVDQSLHDVAGEFSHFISKIIRFPVDKVTLSVTFPAGIGFTPRPTGAQLRFNRNSTWVREIDLTESLDRTGDTWILARQRPPLRRKILLDWAWHGTY